MAVMGARAIGSGTISFGLVSIPIKMYVAASPQSVSFNQLHEKCGGRIKMQWFCPVCEEVVSRKDLVKGYEYAKNQYVQLTDEELKQLEAQKTNAIDILEFVPLDTVDLVYVDKSYYLGPDKGGDKAYGLLSKAMEDTGKVAVGSMASRGKEQLVLLRPYKQGLLLHYVYYADEVRSFEELGIGAPAQLRDGELDMAERLIDQLSSKAFEPDQYQDEYRARVLAAVEQKVAGQEVTVAPAQPAAQIIDLFEALKASLGQAEVGGGKKAKGVRKAEPKAEAAERAAGGKAAGPTKARPRASRSKKKTGSGS